VSAAEKARGKTHRQEEDSRLSHCSITGTGAKPSAISGEPIWSCGRPWSLHHHHKENAAFVPTAQPTYAPAIDALAHRGRPAQPQKPRFNLHEDRGQHWCGPMRTRRTAPYREPAGDSPTPWWSRPYRGSAGAAGRMVLPPTRRPAFPGGALPRRNPRTAAACRRHRSRSLRCTRQSCRSSGKPELQPRPVNCLVRLSYWL
jgi:hypothetical protein